MQRISTWSSSAPERLGPPMAGQIKTYDRGSAQYCSAAELAGGAAHALIQRLAILPPALQLLDCGQDPAPERRAIQIAFLEQVVGTLGRAECRVLAVLVDQRYGGTED